MSNKNNLAKVYHFDLYGKREDKYEFLNENSLNTIEWNELAAEEPNFFFVKKNFEGVGEYEEGFKIDELFEVNNTGLNTEFDELAIQDNKSEAVRVLEILKTKNESEIMQLLNLGQDKIGKVKNAILDIRNNCPEIVKIKIKPFEEKYCIYTGKSNGIMGRPRNEIMRHLVNDKNLGLISMRQYAYDVPYHCYTFLSKQIVTSRLFISNKGYCSVFPLYLYPVTSGQQSTEQTVQRTPNLNPAIVQEIAERLGLEFVEEKTSPTPPKEGLSKPGYITASPKHYKLIKEMRDDLKDNPTEAEKVMWEYLRNKKTGYKIRRQHIIDDFITDFVCLSKKVVIEIDGKIHLKQQEYDELRTARLNELGYEVIRFTNEEVYANPELVASKIKQKLDIKISFVTDVLNSPPLEGLGEVFAPIDILDYIYAVLHSPTYREKYKEFLKIDFPRVPYPKDQDTFWQLVKLGGELRQIHLLESAVVEKPITQYPVGGDNVVTKISFSLCHKTNLETPPKSSPEGRTSEELSSSSPLGRSGGVLIPVGNVYINETQFFGNVPEVAWNFYIGGYQPAQKWLKDRKGRILEMEDVQHYQKIIVALTETDRIMKEIDGIEIIDDEF